MAPSWLAAALGADWRMEPSPKYSVCPCIGSAVAGNTKGMADEASRCAWLMRLRTESRCERTQGSIGTAASKKVTCSPER